MGSFGEYHMAGRMREAVRKIADNAVDSKRPAPRYAVVTSLTGSSPENCWVQFPNETAEQLVALASVRPSRAGQIVRIEGTITDRYVADVLGEAVIAGGGMEIGAMYLWAGENPPANAVRCDGTLLVVEDYPELFSVIQYRHGGSGNTFAVPTESADSANVMVVIRVR